MLEAIKTATLSELKSIIDNMDDSDKRDAFGILTVGVTNGLHIAAQRGDTAIIEYLSSLDLFDLTALNEKGQTAAELAEAAGQHKAAAMLRIKTLWDQKSKGCQFNLNKIFYHFSEAIPKVHKAKDKNLILLFGPTGAGKSTLLNYLAGCAYQYDKENDEIFLLSGQHEIAATSSGRESKTLYPQIVALQKTMFIVIYLVFLITVATKYGLQMQSVLKW